MPSILACDADTPAWLVVFMWQSQTHTHTPRIQYTHTTNKNAHTRTDSHTVVQTHSLSLYVFSSSRHLCFNPSAKILSSKIWLDIFQHWISRESRLALRWILLERHRKWEVEREEESSLFHKRPRLKEDIYLPPCHWSTGGKPNESLHSN